MPIGKRDVPSLDYVTANRFYVEIEEKSSISACFTECSGLSMKVNYETYQEGGVNQQQRLILGHTQFSEVTLQRGLTNDLVFWGWASRSLTQLDPSNQHVNPQRRNINILLFNQGGETVQTWTLIGAVPVGWRSPAFLADSSTAAIESLTLAFEGLKVIVNLNPDGNQTTIGGGATLLKERETNGFFSSH